MDCARRVGNEDRTRKVDALLRAAAIGVGHPLGYGAGKVIDMGLSTVAVTRLIKTTGASASERSRMTASDW